MADLRTISKKLDDLCTHVNRIDENVELIKSHLIGTLEQRGLARRVEDLEENERKRMRYITASLVAAIVAIITWPIRTLWSIVAGGGS